jgi:signal transduction histidine kinase
MKRLRVCVITAFGICGLAAWWFRGNKTNEKTFQELLRELTVGATPQAILERVAERATKLVSGTAAYVEQVDIARNELIATAVYNGHRLPTQGVRGPYHGSVAEQAINATRPIIVRDVSRSTSILAYAGHRPAAVLPLIVQGEALGALIVIQGRKPMNSRTLARLDTMASTAAVSLQRATILQELRQSMQAREHMLRILAHDLRNPINTISMAASSLRDANTKESLRTTMIGMIDRSTRRVNRLIEDLIDNAIIERSGKLPMNPQLQGARDIVDEVCELSKVQARKKAIEVYCHIESNATIFADRDRLLQVLTNLLDNAIKFTPEGGTVRLKAEEEPDAIRFLISDTGPGISEDEREHVFEPYWQASSTAHSGVGLGLAIAKQVVEQHGGEIWVESKPGQGTTFVFTIPTNS